MSIENIKKLGVKLFGKDFVDSNEFRIFAQGNPHLLRIRIEEEIIRINNELTKSDNYYSKEEISTIFGLSGAGDEIYKQFNLPDKPVLLKRRDLLKELDRLIMEYIENTN
jgi:hypothetical protein